MGKHNKWRQSQPESAAADPQVALDERAAEPSSTRPARYIALTGLMYTNRAGDRRMVQISEVVDDLNEEDAVGYLANKAIEPADGATSTDDESEDEDDPEAD
jgi:hypothetical protein